MEKPNFYAILPANVRYDKRLKPMEKILYSEITSLTNKEGYCYANNSYFAELYEVHKNTISVWINNLVEMGYLELEIIYYEGTKNIKERRLYICRQPINKNIDTPINEKIEDNNKYINNKFNNIYIFNSDDFKVKFDEFIQMRRLDNGGLSPMQIELYQKTLYELSKGDEKKAIKLLEKAIMLNWRTFYAEREVVSSGSYKNRSNNIINKHTAPVDRSRDGW